MKSFICQPFGARVFVTADVPTFVQKYNRYSDTTERIDAHEMGGCAGLAAMLSPLDQDTIFLIFCPREYEIGTLYHEALHMAHFIMYKYKVPIDLESTELQAYLMEHIADCVAQKLK